MHERHLLSIALASLAWTLSPAAQAQEHAFLRITSPTELESFKSGAACRVTGLLQLPDGKKPDTLIVRFRLYVPIAKDFVVAQESIAEVKKPLPGKNIFAFESNLAVSKEGGDYLLKVDCIDLHATKYPKSLLATQSIFIRVDPAPNRYR